jgi:hypothetical protein
MFDNISQYPSQERYEELRRIVMTLDLRDKAALIGMLSFGDECEVFVGMLENNCIVGKIDDVTLNGLCLQINLGMSNYKDLSEENVFGYALAQRETRLNPPKKRGRPRKAKSD